MTTSEDTTPPEGTPDSTPSEESARDASTDEPAGATLGHEPAPGEPTAPASAFWGRVRLALLVAVVLAVVLVVATDSTSSFEPERLRETLRDSGVWGPVVFLAIFWFVQPFALSAHVLVIGGSLVWSPVEIFLLGWAGTVGSGLTSFFFARFIARDWVQRRVPEKLHRYDRGLAEHGFRTVLLLRVFFFTTHPVQMLLGVSRVRFWPFFAGSALGFVPGVLLDVLVGQSVVAWLLARLFG